MPLPSSDALVAGLPWAAAAGLVAGLGTRRASAGVFAGALALLACARAAPPPLGPADPARLAELVVPGLLSPASDGTTGMLAGAWLGVPAAGGSIDVGSAGLMAALLGLALAPGAWAWAARVGLVLGAGGLAVAAPLGLELQGLLTQLSLAALAGMGLAAVYRRDGRDSALLVVGGCAVILAGALAVAAASAGASDPRQLMEPFAEALRQQGLAQPTAIARDAAAAQLVTLLDRSALSAFAAMTALLVLLKTRRPWAVLLVAIGSLAEVAWPWIG